MSLICWLSAMAATMYEPPPCRWRQAFQNLRLAPRRGPVACPHQWSLLIRPSRFFHVTHAALVHAGVAFVIRGEGGGTTAVWNMYVFLHCPYGLVPAVAPPAFI